MGLIISPIIGFGVGFLILLVNFARSLFGGKKSPPTFFAIGPIVAHEPMIASPTTQRRRRQNARIAT